MNRRLWMLVLFICIHNFSSSAQNLVPNGSFEEYPYELIRKDGLLTIYLNQTTWKSFGSIDLFSKANETTPCNSFGSICPQSGSAFSGLNCLYPKEVAQIKLKHPLVKDKNYCISFYKGESINSDLTINPDALFSDTLITDFNKNAFRSNKIILSPCNIKSGGWTKMYALYKATGNEQFISIGNFDMESEIQKNKLPKWHHSYSYIDNVEVKEVNGLTECECYAEVINQIEIPNTKCKCELITNTNETKKSTTIPAAISFDSGNSTLLPASLGELDKLVTLMKTKPEITLEIQGHTDNEGTEIVNKTLSTERAQTVMDYLISKGINKTRLSSTCFGSTRPINTNTTEQGKALNRRVEFLIK